MTLIVTSNKSLVIGPEAIGLMSVVAPALKLVAIAQQGPPGATGSSASGFPPVNFSYGDASPAAVIILSATSEITRVSLQIDQTFDGIGAKIQLGTTRNPGLLMDFTQNSPDMISVFETIPRVELGAGTPIMLTITPGSGASQGSGQFVISSVSSI